MLFVRCHTSREETTAVTFDQKNVSGLLYRNPTVELVCGCSREACLRWNLYSQTSSYGNRSYRNFLGQMFSACMHAHREKLKKVIERFDSTTFSILYLTRWPWCTLFQRFLYLIVCVPDALLKQADGNVIYRPSDYICNNTSSRMVRERTYCMWTPDQLASSVRGN